MGCRYIYSIYDAKSGALVAKGNAAKLVGLGLFRDAGVLSTSYRKNRECKKPRKYRIEREKVVKTFVMTTPQKALRSMYIYSCYDARDKLLGRGTAWELVESGLFGSETSIYSCYNKGGVNDRLGVARMTRVSEMRELQPKRKAAVHRKAEPLRGISHPTALQWDVHDLLVYNRKAKKQGKRELSYGQWSAMGKPAEP